MIFQYVEHRLEDGVGRIPAMNARLLMSCALVQWMQSPGISSCAVDASRGDVSKEGWEMGTATISVFSSEAKRASNPPPAGSSTLGSACRRLVIVKRQKGHGYRTLGWGYTGKAAGEGGTAPLHSICPAVYHAQRMYNMH